MHRAGNRTLYILILLAMVVLLLWISTAFPAFGQGATPTPIAPQVTRLAFSALINGKYQIFTINPDGTGLRALSNNSYNDTEPAWSPDGSKIAFASDRHGNREICIMTSFGGNQRCITDNSTPNGKPNPTLPEDFSPVWSPDNQSLAFVSTRLGNAQIFVSRPDGTSVVNLSNNTANNTHPAWSPDLRTIAYTSDSNGNHNICIMDASGFNQRCLTNNRTANRLPDPTRPEDRDAVWSANSQRLVFVSTRQDRNREIFVMNADGSNPINISQSIAADESPTWGPNGDQVAFISNREGSTQIFIRSLSQLDAQLVRIRGLADTVLTNLAWEPGKPPADATPTMTLSPTPGGTSSAFDVTPTPSKTAVITATPTLLVRTNTPVPTSTPIIATPGPNPNQLFFVNAAPPNGFYNQAYSWDVVASGGVGRYSYSIASGSLPPGLTLDSDGHVRGIPTDPDGDYYSFVVQARDSMGNSGVRAYRIAMIPTLSLAPTSIPNGRVGVPYVAVLQANGGEAPYIYTISAGTFPSGLWLNTNTGEITGIPIAPGGIFTFTITATDANGFLVKRTYSNVKMVPNIILDRGPLPNGYVNNHYDFFINVSGGTAPYWVSLIGSLPNSLDIGEYDNTTFLLSGDPDYVGVFTFTVVAHDNLGFTGQQQYTLTIGNITLSPSILPNIEKSTATNPTFYDQTITASGGAGSYTYSVLSGTLPPGLTLSTNGNLSGTPTTGGVYDFVVIAQDSNGDRGAQSYQIIVIDLTFFPAGPALSSGRVGIPYNSGPISVLGGIAPYTYALAPGSQLPAGLNFNTSNGSITGTPNEAGIFSFYVRATDSQGHSKDNLYTIQIAMVMQPSTLPNGSTSQSYNATVSLVGGQAPYVYQVTNGFLPGNVTLDTSTGQLSGIPSTGGIFQFTITGDDASPNNAPVSITYTITIYDLIILPLNLPTGAEETPYTAQLSVNDGGLNGVYTYQIMSGALPTGLSLSAGGLISGTPLDNTATGIAVFTIQATDTRTGLYGLRNYALNILRISADPSVLPEGAVGNSYTAALTGTGGTAPYTFTLVSDGGSGLSVNAAGLVTGFPSTSSTYTLTVRVTDGSGFIGTSSHSVTIRNIGLTPALLPSGAVGNPYSTTLTGTGGAAGATYTFVALSGMPSGLTLASDGTLSGIPTAVGNYTLSVQVTTDTGLTSVVDVSISIIEITVEPTSLTSGAQGSPYTVTFSATGGTGSYTFTASGLVPPGLNLVGNALSGIPTTAGSYTFTIRATDGNSLYGERAYTLDITMPLSITPASLPNATEDTFYSAQLGGQGGAGSYSFSGSGLPAWLSLDGSGLLSGTPPTGASSGTNPVTFSVTMTDANSQSVTQPYALTIDVPPPPSPVSPVIVRIDPDALTNIDVVPVDSTPQIVPTSDDTSTSPTTIAVRPPSLPDGVLNVTYEVVFSADGGTPPYAITWIGGELPPGLTFADGRISGVPTAAGSYAITLAVIDSSDPVLARQVTYTLVIRPIDIVPTSLPSIQVGQGVGFIFNGIGGDGNYTYAVSGNLPPGLGLVGNTLAGIATAEGVYDFTVTVTDGQGNTGSRTYSLVVTPAAEPTAEVTSEPTAEATTDAQPTAPVTPEP